MLTLVAYFWTTWCFGHKMHSCYKLNLRWNYFTLFFPKVFINWLTKEIIFHFLHFHFHRLQTMHHFQYHWSEFLIIISCRLLLSFFLHYFTIFLFTKLCNYWLFHSLISLTIWCTHKFGSCMRTSNGLLMATVKTLSLIHI